MGVQYFLLLGKLIIWLLFLFGQFPPLLAQHLINGSRFLNNTLFHYFRPPLLHIDHEGIQRFLDVLLILLMLMLLMAMMMIMMMPLAVAFFAICDTIHAIGGGVVDINIVIIIIIITNSYATVITVAVAVAN